jgi:hypothetical protein
MRQNLLLAAKPDATNVITKDILSHLWKQLVNIHTLIF